MPLKSCVIIVLVASLLTGCASKEPVGDNGGLLGMAPVGTFSSGAAAVLGTFIGSPSAKELDAKDKTLSAEAVTSALQTSEAGKTTGWRNPATGHSGDITPGPIYSVNDYSCRDYVQHLVVGDRSETQRATACRQPDGTWRALI